ncbi:hypothetical protein SDC9_27888 [bioreactor metagenome]|uniref:DUF4372 domain-containing protein n=1 Tax=bioreactor metagenome TaxID=1076179 RepID=A0A644USU5_9ZZZZ
MHKDKFVFSQLIVFLDSDKFNYIVRKHDGDKYVKHFTCWNQLLSLMFGQLSNRESLRDLIVALDAHHSKCYHLGIGRNVSRSSLVRVNQDRDYRIFKEYAYYLINEARQKRATEIFKLGGNINAFDSTTIDLCLAVFWWAKFRKKKGGIKVHTLYDVETQIPAFIHITEAAVHDSKTMKKSLMNLVLTTSLTGLITILRCCIRFIRLTHSLLSGQRKTCNTNPSNGNADSPRMYFQM